MDGARERSGGERTLLAALLLLAAVACFEPRGSGLAEPDETRYAEISREMLAAGDFVVPRLNGLPYFEKPPLLYWANATAFRVFGESPWAARLPTRVAGLGTALLLVLAVASRRGRREGLAAGIVLLACPIGFLMARTNLTDGMLAFFFTATLFAGRAAIERRMEGRPWLALAALTGAAASGAFLTKGLVALALPGLILLIWCAATGRLAGLAALTAASPAPVVFLALAAPWFALVEHLHPGFLQFFFIHEHFQRFATGAAKRHGPVYYFVPVFAAGFLPGLAFFFAGARRACRRADDGFFFFVWFALVFGFFSLSQSKLPPYIFPAIPAAAALAARGIGGTRRPWIVQALLATALAAALVSHPVTRTFLVDAHLQGFIAPALAILVIASWGAVLAAGSSASLALASLAMGWAALLGSVVVGWPRVPQARLGTELAAAARAAGAPERIPLVGYKDYVNGVSWELKTPIPVASYRGELEPDFETNPATREALFWPADRFWSLWKSDHPVLALVRLQDLVELMTAAPPARVVRWSGRHAIVANFPEAQ
ncbi:MAG TPA: phospholipid carrier-dependent glycosyltransferase [Thermoanaerobaculia bacterium]|jgi:4-amino-4-deoxy-L-arabinose transferase-like glycosyltransferase|nr:phospholipid carrier-dependent glycosyltransferase [Thermoanaerobaculia bacterium]